MGRIAYSSTNSKDPVLSRIEAAVAASVNDLDVGKQASIDLVHRPRGTSLVATVDSIVIVDGTCRVTLPDPGPNKGHRVFVIASSAAASVTVMSASRVLGAATHWFSGPAKHEYVSTGQEWW